MTQEEKQLLLVDLCARLPYGVKCSAVLDDGTYGGLFRLSDELNSEHLRFSDIPYAVRPYLRPLSSMTEDEKEELKQYLDAEELDCNGFGYIEGGTLENYVSNVPYSICSYVIDWLLAHHFDYRGLIDRGLALEATEGMYDRN